MNILRFSIPTLALVAASLAFAGPAAASNCGDKILSDDLDGRIDNVYPVKCYRLALEDIHVDSKIYSSFASDINRAFQSAVAAYGSKHGGGGPPANFLVRPGKGAHPDASGARGGKRHRSFFGNLISKIGPTSADSIPIPLLVLGGLALLLLVAAAASLTARRIQARRAQPAPAPIPPDRPRP